MNNMGRKWNNIKEKKASKDANTSRIYAKFGREIYVAAKTGRTGSRIKSGAEICTRTCKNI